MINVLSAHPDIGVRTFDKGQKDALYGLILQSSIETAAVTKSAPICVEPAAPDSTPTGNQKKAE